MYQVEQMKRKSGFKGDDLPSPDTLGYANVYMVQRALIAFLRPDLSTR